ncbi:hypothetical protein B0T16DRAFT_170692 [Cercophora newfieldiana]|uniref:SET domain-containing protein n=1 Tax=Cercophora newfieldiana TaxID=92897 RepID=A0AA39Y7L2_9PEZI|nr:hypothetical protein B0T16DRAFT_170692 [Cercophora newfieldiana]
MITSFIFIFLTGVAQGEGWDAFPGAQEALDLQCGHNPVGPLRPGVRQTYCAAIVDDGTKDASSRSPWSYTPICVDPVDNSDEASKLCTYTVSSLRGGPGMSIITKPDIAAGLTSMLQHPEISWLEKQRGVPFIPDTRVSYDIKELPNKGYGVISTAFIPKDSIVMLELPYMLKISDPSPWNHKGAIALMQQAAKRLTSKDQSRLLQMARQDKGYVLDDIFRTNSFRVTVEGVGHAALYPEIARINHDCKPNTIIRYSTQTLALEIVAYRDIEPGEEITLSYFALNLRYHQRIQAIKSWGFNCSCSFCADEATRQKSDRRRDDIARILQAITRKENITRDIVSKAVGKLEDLVNEEGLSAQMGDLLYMVADACMAAKDFQLAREIGEEALKVQRRYAGFDNDRTQDVVKLLETVDELEHGEETAFASAS